MKIQGLRRTDALGATAILLLAGCAQPASSQPVANPVMIMPNETSPSGKFVPPAGRTLFIIGQDNDTIGEYMDAIPLPQPGGVTSYTSLDRLEGLTSMIDYGAGTVFLDELAKSQPQGIISLGLYLVGYLTEITSGQADHQIDSLLDLLSSYQRPVFLRFGYEFDGMWNHYDPEEYKQAWIYFRNRMLERDIPNIAMVWQSATYCDGTYQQKPIEAWYPGDGNVDWMALSLFTQADCGYRPLDELLDFARVHNKPVMVAEAAPQRYETGKLTYSVMGKEFEARTAGQIWGEWYAPFFKYVHDHADLIRAVAYINTCWDSQPMWGEPYQNGYWGDSRVQANDLIKEHWLAELDQNFWLMGGPDLLASLGYSK